VSEFGQHSPGPAPLGTTLVVGAGLVGTSIGQALTNAGVRVLLSDKTTSHAVVAAGLGAGEVFDPAADEQVDVVVVATPPQHIPAAVLAALVQHPQAVVTDVASVKSAVLTRLETTNEEISRYVGSHPMAGSQHTGPLTASAKLFVDRTWVVTPHVGNAPEHVEVVRELARACGSRVVEMAPDEHDEAVAQVSHLPQLMSTLTAGNLRHVPDGHLQLAGQGIRDVTRIAASDPGLWRQIITANADAVRAELHAVRADLDELVEALDDPDALEAFMARGRVGARSLPGKHGARPADWESVVVEIPDAPGALARLFADIEAEGVNVEDLSIEHDASREVGWLQVDVAPDHAVRLRSAMQAKSWTLRP